MGIMPPNMEHLMHPFFTLLAAGIGAIWILGLVWLWWAWRREAPERRRGPRIWDAGMAGRGSARAWRKEGRQ